MDDFTSCAGCKYNNGEKCELFGRVIGMHGCSNGETRKPKTNGDRIRSMTDEELAEIFQFQPECHLCLVYLDGCDGYYGDDEMCKKNLLDWLKQEGET